MRQMENAIEKYFNNEENFWTNQQVLGMREVFRGIMVKDWASTPVESTDFTQHNKVLIKKDVNFYCEYWNNRRVVLHTLEVRKYYLRKETQEVKLEALRGSIKIYNRHVNAYPINDESASLESVSMWIKKERFFRTKTKISGQQDIRDLLLIS